MIKKTKTFLNWATSLGGGASLNLTKFLRYTASGTATTFLDFILLYSLTDLVGIYYLYSGMISYTISTSSNYYINRKWGFKETKRHFFHGYLYFIAFALIGLVVNTALFAFAVEILSLNYLIARLIIAMIVGIWNFLMNRYVTFR